MADKHSSTDEYARRLLLSNLLREPAIVSAVHALQLPLGSRGLDAGCGIGVHTPLLAQAIGSAGHVTGLDLSPELLRRAQARAEQLGLTERISFQTGDVTRLPFEDNSFDWLWCADTLHPSLFAVPLEAVKELARVVKPDGKVAVLYWSSQKLLPGHALLEARLDVAFAEAVPYMKVAQPGLHFLRALGWLSDAGLTDITAQTFVADVYAPLSEDVRSALTMTFDMFWGSMQSALSPNDRAEYERLCLAASPDFILNQPDYCAFLTYSLFVGTVMGA